MIYYQIFKNIKDISYEILRTLPVVRLGKKKIIPFLLAEEDLKKNEIQLFFEPLIPLSKKNF